MKLLQFSNVLLFISIHAPHEGVRHLLVIEYKWEILFQSTHPTRGCDFCATLVMLAQLLFQSTHPTRGCDVYTQKS